MPSGMQPIVFLNIFKKFYFQILAEKTALPVL